MKRKTYLFLYLKGMAMGISDIVPGISGGTIALITGIYEEFIYSIKSFDTQAIMYALRFQGVLFWKKINGSFIVPVLAGIATSIILFSRFITYCLTHYPIRFSSFFFGLILASLPMVLHKITWRPITILMIVLGSVIGYAVAIATPLLLSSNFPFVFLGGVLAICAMILPGISGSLILLLMGQYVLIIQAVAELDLIILLIFSSGCLLGILFFSRLLSWGLTHFRMPIITLMAGLMMGSLSKVWPWKYTEGNTVDREKTNMILKTDNVWPTNYVTQTGNPSQFTYALFFSLLGGGVIIIIEKISSSTKKQS